MPLESFPLSRRTLGAAAFAAAGAPFLAGFDWLGGPRDKPIPLDYDASGRLLVTGAIETDAPRPLLWDTGSARSVLDETYAKSLGLAVGPGTEIAGTTGTALARKTNAAVAIEGLGRFRLPFLVAPFASLPGSPVGLLGADLVAREAFRIDYAARTLFWRASPPKTLLPMTMHGFVPTIEAKVNGFPLRLHLDTGAGQAPTAEYVIHLTQGEAERIGLEGEPIRFVAASGTGGDAAALPVFALASLEIAGRTLAPAFVIIRPPLGYFAAAEALGFIGNAALDKLMPYFDYRGGLFGIGA